VTKTECASEMRGSTRAKAGTGSTAAAAGAAGVAGVAITLASNASQQGSE
jgi:hypothetical protein